MIIQIQISRQNRFGGKFEYWQSKLFLPSHIFFWLRMSKKLTFDIFLLSKKRNVSSPELCDICATCFVSTKYNINSFFNFNQHDSFFRIKLRNGAVSSFPGLQLFVSSTNQNAELPSCAFWLVENTKSWRAGKLEMASALDLAKSEQFAKLQFSKDKIDQNTNCAKLPSTSWLFLYNFIQQLLSF